METIRAFIPGIVSEFVDYYYYSKQLRLAQSTEKVVVQANRRLLFYKWQRMLNTGCGLQNTKLIKCFGAANLFEYLSIRTT